MGHGYHCLGTLVPKVHLENRGCQEGFSAALGSLLRTSPDLVGLETLQGLRQNSWSSQGLNRDLVIVHCLKWGSQAAVSLSRIWKEQWFGV
jgi:hypothetical protein